MPATLIKGTPTQAFFCKICEILKNTFFTERIRWLLLKSADILATSLPITLLNKNVIAGILL